MDVTPDNQDINYRHMNLSWTALKAATILFLRILIWKPDTMQAQVASFNLHENWQFRKSGDSVWMPARVPGTVHTDLLYNQCIEPPYYRTNEAQLQWIEHADWEYQLLFNADSQLLNHQEIELVFEGLDTYAEVTLNGSRILTSDNMFLPWRVDVKNTLKSGPNRLHIQFFSPIQKVMPAYNDFPCRIPVSDNDHAEKRVSVYSRKAAYHYGWDWGPRFVTSGIWKPVYLRAWNEMHITDFFIKQLYVNADSCSLEAQVEIRSAEEGVYNLQISSSQDTRPIVTQKVLIHKGFQTLAVRFDMKQVRLWYPNGMGEPYQYNFRAVITDGDTLLVSQSIRRGLRKIDVVQESHAQGKSFYFRVNEKPLFIKGANYIPQDNFLPEVSDPQYRRLIKTCVESNMNMLRVWGGGIYENTIFYDLCDSLGILVWQDFMFSCAMYPPFLPLLANIHKEAVYQVKRLRNHACLALWCGNNEIASFLYWGFMKGACSNPNDSIALMNTYSEIFHSILPAAVKAGDEEKFYWSSSPSEENYQMHFNTLLQSGDMHYWGVWWGKDRFEKYNTVIAPFMSEYGFQSFPDMETIATFALPEDLQLNSKVMNAHQKSSIGNETIFHYMQNDFKIPKNFTDMVYVSQLLQAEGIKTAIEAHRRAKPFCMGTMYWQLNDCWPGASWSSMDYNGRWKALQYEVKRAFSDYLVSAVHQNQNIEIYVVSDAPKTEVAQLHFTLIDFEGKILKKECQNIAVTCDSGKRICALKENDWVSPDLRNKTLLNIALQIQGACVAQNNFFFEKPKNLQLPSTKVHLCMTDSSTLEIQSKHFVKSLQLSIPGVVNPFSDNYFDLLPGQKKYVQIRLPNSSAWIQKIVVRSLADVQ
jgi:beta-mannosidase